MAGRHGSDSALHVILDHDASVTANDAWNDTALHFAAVVGSVSCVHQLFSVAALLTPLITMKTRP